MSHLPSSSHDWEMARKRNYEKINCLTGHPRKQHYLWQNIISSQIPWPWLECKTHSHSVRFSMILNGTVWTSPSGMMQYDVNESKKLISTTWRQPWCWLRSLNCAFRYGVLLAHSGMKLIPTTWGSHDVVWRSLNYAFSYDTMALRSDSKLSLLLIQLNITYKHTVPWLSCNLYIYWTLMHWEQKSHTHNLRSTKVLMGGLWTTHSAMMQY